MLAAAAKIATAAVFAVLRQLNFGIWRHRKILCVPARLSPVASMAPGDVCHGPRCSLAGLGPVALEYRSCHWPGGSAGSPQCVRPMGCWFFPVPRPPYVCAVSWAAGLLFIGVPARFAVLLLRCPRPLGSCSPVCSLGVLCCVCGVLGKLAPVHRCARCVRCACAMGGCVPLPPPLNFRFFFDRTKKTGARVHCRHRHGQLVRRCNSVVSSGVCRRCRGGSRAPGVRLTRPDVHGLGRGWVWLGVSLLLELAGWAAVWAVGVGCGYVVPSAGLVSSQGLAVSGCGSGLICDWVLARLGGCDGSGPGFGAFGRSGARCRVRWHPLASGSFGDFWAGAGVAPRGGGLLGNRVRRRRRWPGGQARRVVWCAGLLGCCGCRRCRCADACGVLRGCVCAGLGFG